MLQGRADDAERCRQDLALRAVPSQYPSMTGEAGKGSGVDPVVVKGGSLLAYWALVGLAAMLGWIPVDLAVALAIGPVALLIIEFIAIRVAARIAG